MEGYCGGGGRLWNPGGRKRGDESQSAGVGWRCLSIAPDAKAFETSSCLVRGRGMGGKLFATLLLPLMQSVFPARNPCSTNDF